MWFVWLLCVILIVGILFLLFDFVANDQHQENENGWLIFPKFNLSGWFQTSSFRSTIFSTGEKSSPYNRYANIRNPVGGFNLSGEMSESSDWEEQPPYWEEHPRRRTARKSKSFGTSPRLRKNSSSFIENILTFIGFGTSPGVEYYSASLIDNISNVMGSHENVQYPMRSVSPRGTSDPFGNRQNIPYPMRSVSPGRQSNSSGSHENVQYPMRSVSPRETSDPFGNRQNVQYPMRSVSPGRQSNSSGSLENVVNPMRRIYPDLSGSHENVQYPMRSVSPRDTSDPFGNRQNIQHPMRSVSPGRQSNPSGNNENVENSMRSVSPRREPSDSFDIQIPNVEFYQNIIPAAPNNERIEYILTHWTGNYVKLQENTTYLQWLFPNRIAGQNPEAHVLNDVEAEIIQNTPVLRNRVKRAFIMMLDLYGMEITGGNQVQLKENHKKRLKQLNKKDSANFLSITRILLAIKELGHSDLMLPWMKCLANLIYNEKKLCHAKCSFETYWIDTLDAEDNIKLKLYKTFF